MVEFHVQIQMPGAPASNAGLCSEPVTSAANMENTFSCRRLFEIDRICPLKCPSDVPRPRDRRGAGRCAPRGRLPSSRRTFAFVLICLPMAVLPPRGGDGVLGTTLPYGAASNPITRRLTSPECKAGEQRPLNSALPKDYFIKARDFSAEPVVYRGASD